MFAASNSIVRKLSYIGAQHLVEGRNPISLCNVLFVSNLCALLVLIPGFYRQFSWQKLHQISRQEWLYLLVVGIFSGALAPAFIFTALSETMVSNVIIIGRVEPPVILALSFWLLGDRLNRLEVIGTFVSLVGVALTFILQNPQSNSFSMGFIALGKGEILTLLAVLAAALILGEQLTSAHYIGGIVIIAGLLLTQIGIRKKTSPKKPVSKVVSVKQMEAKIGFKGI